MMTCSRGRAEAVTSAPVARISDGESGLAMMTSTEARATGRKSVRMSCEWLVGNLQLEMPKTRVLKRTMNRMDSEVCSAFI